MAGHWLFRRQNRGKTRPLGDSLGGGIRAGRLVGGNPFLFDASDNKRNTDSLISWIMGHADYFGLPRQTPLAKRLFGVHELRGLLAAVAHMRPAKSLAGIEFSSINKKLKDKAFARSVSREEIRKGAEEMGADFQGHVLYVARAVESFV